ncbi:MAG: amidohydrolase family protein, partial [Gemmatimonadota bacterium]
TSNAFLGSGSFPLQRAKRTDVTIGIGSDVGAGPLFSPLDVLRHFAYLNHVQPTELLYRGTLAGAEALSVDHQTGRLAIDKAADLVVLEPPADAGGDPLQRFVQCVFRNPETRVVATLVEGRVVFGRLPA